jgi:hypothetical protein
MAPENETFPIWRVGRFLKTKYFIREEVGK